MRPPTADAVPVHSSLIAHESQHQRPVASARLCCLAPSDEASGQTGAQQFDELKDVRDTKFSILEESLGAVEKEHPGDCGREGLCDLFATG